MLISDGKGYIVPVPIDPGSLRCFRVYVPADTQYLGAFWAAYEFFTTWLAWARDPFKRGKEAAKVWRKAYDKARAEFESGQGCEMNLTNIRQNPMNPCELQASYDGGQTWVVVADLSLCGGAGGTKGILRVNDGQIEQWDDCAHLWVEIGVHQGPGDSGSYHSHYDSSNGACDGAANITKWLSDMTHTQLQSLITGGTIGSTVGAIASYLIGATGAGGALATLTIFVADLIAEGIDILEDADLVDIDTEFREILSRYMDDEGIIQEPQFTYAVTRLFARRDEEPINSGERVKWGHMTNLLSLFGPYIASDQNKYANMVDVDCSAAGWAHTFDFSADRQDWYRLQKPGGFYGTWHDGIWESSYFTVGGIGYRVLDIGRALAPTTLKRLEMSYDFEFGVVPAPNQGEWTFYPNLTETDPFIVEDNQDHSGLDQTFVWEGSQDITGLSLYIQAGKSPDSSDPGGFIKIKSIRIEGIGADPFA